MGKAPISGPRRKRRKDKGKHAKAMAAVLTGVDVKKGGEKLLMDEEVPLDNVADLAEQAREFVGEVFGEEASDNEVVAGCRRKTGVKEEDGISNTLLGVVRRLEQDRHFKKIQFGEFGQSSDTDCETGVQKTADVENKPHAEIKKCFDFTK